MLHILIKRLVNVGYYNVLFGPYVGCFSKPGCSSISCEWPWAVSNSVSVPGGQEFGLSLIFLCLATDFRRFFIRAYGLERQQGPSGAVFRPQEAALLQMLYSRSSPVSLRLIRTYA